MLVGMSVNERFGDSHKSNANFSVFRIMKQGLDIADSLKKMGGKVNLTCGQSHGKNSHNCHNIPNDTKTKLVIVSSQNPNSSDNFIIRQEYRARSSGVEK